MTNDEREALIEEAAKAIQDAWSIRTMRPVEERPGLAETAAFAALAVFEQAHTPTYDEREGCGCTTRQVRYVDGEWARELELIPCETHRRPVQAEPTDAQVLVALNAWYAKERKQNGWPIGSNAAELADYSPQTQDRMRAALRAAYEEGKKR